MHSYVFLTSPNGIEALVISVGHDVRLVDPWPRKQQVIGSVGINDTKMNCCSDGPHCEIDTNIANVTDAFPRNPDT